jgi:hypothetical protein
VPPERTTRIHERTTARHTTRRRREDRGCGRDHRRRCSGYGRPGRSGSGGALPDAGAIGSRPARGGVFGWTGGSAPASTGGPATGARDLEPRLRLGSIRFGPARGPQGYLAPGPRPVRTDRFARPDAHRGPTAARSRSTAAAAARIHFTDRPGVRDSLVANGARPGRAASAAWVLSVERATAARVRAAYGARPGRATDGRAGSSDALTPWAAL